MDVAEAVRRRISTRAFKPDPVPGHVLREMLELADRAPSGGNLQPWRVYALAGAPLAQFKALIAAHAMEEPEYDVYPPNLWEPFRTRRFVCGEDLYASIGMPREDRPARFRQLAKTPSSSARRPACSSASTASSARRSGRTSACSCRP